MKKIIFCSLLFAVTQAHAAEMDCSYQHVEAMCKKLAAMKFSDGSSVPSAAAMKNREKDFKKNNDMLPTSDYAKKREDRFAEAQKYLIQAILQRRDRSQATPAELNLINRLEAMKLTPESDDDYKAVCSGKGTIAHKPANNTLIVCPIVSDYPNAGIVHAMATFMARSLGRCGTGSSKDDTGFDPISADQYPFSISADSKTKSVRACVTQGRAHAVTPGQGAAHIKFSDAKIKDYARKNGFDPDDLEHTNPEKFKSDKLESYEDFKTEVKDLPACDSEITNDTSDSAMADWLGADVLARYLKDNPVKVEKPDDAYEPLSFIIDNSCRVMNTPEILKKNGHPDWATRFNQIIFTNPALREALNCKADLKAICPYSVHYSNTGEPKAAGDPAAK